MLFDTSPALMRIDIRDFISDYDLTYLLESITEKTGHTILYLVGQAPLRSAMTGVPQHIASDAWSPNISMNGNIGSEITAFAF